MTVAYNEQEELAYLAYGGKNGMRRRSLHRQYGLILIAPIGIHTAGNVVVLKIVTGAMVCSTDVVVTVIP